MPNILMFPSVNPARSKGGIQFHQGHSLRQKRGGILPAIDPGVNGIRPLLHHMPTLHLILGLVIDAARRTPVLVRQALFDPVAVKAVIPHLILLFSVLDGDRPF
ncbi:hypothetical protein ACV1DC_22435 [Aeromonas caviae]